jgi:hypothetical protein
MLLMLSLRAGDVSKHQTTAIANEGLPTTCIERKTEVKVGNKEESMKMLKKRN